ncbi:serine O-acetyltransferase EpsC [Pontibacter sp. MBLB2868]|uniref:serine O-acetyltransferase EpsC n=1 Tax=Pontibacter sp. MBLB2868 TaxID=3451555 RepID=UPI003F752013
MAFDNKPFIEYLASKHRQAMHIVPRSLSCTFLDGLLQLLFPPLSEQTFKTAAEVQAYMDKLQSDLEFLLLRLQERLVQPPGVITRLFFDALPQVYQQLMEDAATIEAGDPAATSVEEVIRTYPGFYAVAVYRVAHLLCQNQVPLLPRVLSEYAHAKTGIDIHPKARIGNAFCIDHGTGIVIGETAVIGNHVKIYQGVTLGAVSVEKAMVNTKRHPTIEDHVVIYAGATILGGKTVVGKESIIGGNVWLTESVPPYSRVYHRPQIRVRQASEPDDVLNFSI